MTANLRHRLGDRGGEGAGASLRFATVWRVDVEIARDPVSGRRRRVSRYVHGTREDAEVALARLRVADHEKRLPNGGTNARSVRAAFQLYLQAVDTGLIELAPATVVTSPFRGQTHVLDGLADGGRLATSGSRG